MVFKLLIGVGLIGATTFWYTQASGSTTWTESLWSESTDLGEVVGDGAVAGAMLAATEPAPVAEVPGESEAEVEVLASAPEEEVNAAADPGFDKIPTTDAPAIPPVEPDPAAGEPVTADPVSSGPANAPPPPGHSGHVSAGANRAKELKLPADVTYVPFDELASFWYEPPDPDRDGAGSADKDGADKEGADEQKNDGDRNDQIPAKVKTYNKKKVAVEGYMVPISVEDGMVTSFILSRFFASCCFGQMPEMNEWVEVEVVGEGFDYLPYGSVLVTGEFEVGEVFDDYGYVRSLYRMKAESISEQF